MERPYWENGETPQIWEDHVQRFKYYKAAGLIEISKLVPDTDGTTKELKRQVISAYKIGNNAKLRSMILDFLEDSGFILPAEHPANKDGETNE